MHYDYYCPQCDQVRDIKKSMLDDSPQFCPVCGCEKVERIYSAPTVYYPGRFFGERDGWFWDTPFTGGTKPQRQWCVKGKDEQSV